MGGGITGKGCKGALSGAGNILYVGQVLATEIHTHVKCHTHIKKSKVVHLMYVSYSSIKKKNVIKTFKNIS